MEEKLTEDRYASTSPSLEVRESILRRRVRNRSNLLLKEDDTFYLNFRKYMMEFGDATDINGLRYIVEDRSRSEKIIWAIIMIACVVSCTYWMIYLIQQFYGHPIIVSFRAKEDPIYSIPFPAVTICPESKHTNNFSYLEALIKINSGQNLTQEEKKIYHNILPLCDITFNEETASQRAIRLEGKHPLSQDYYEVLQEFQLKINDYMYSCRWRGIKEDCTKIFTPVLTSQGICHSFNILDKKFVYNDDIIMPSFAYQGNVKTTAFDAMKVEYEESADLEVYPRRAIFAGEANSLRLVLTQNMHYVDSACKRGLDGFRLIIHNPSEVPRPSKYYYRIPLNHSVNVALEPRTVTTMEKIKKYDVTKRDCYMPGERKLRFYKFYTREHCQKECYTNFTYERCKCVAFYMPIMKGMPICGAPHIDCVKKQEWNLDKDEIERVFEAQGDIDMSQSEEENVIHGKSTSRCSCMPLCNNMIYSAQLSLGGWELGEYHHHRDAIARNLSKTSDKLTMSMIILYLKRDYYLQVIRHEIYGMTEFISNIGGLLNLFTGVTVLGIIEILYFCTLRIGCNRKMYGNWSGKVE